MSNTSLWVFGCLGGLLPMLIRIVKSATSPTLPDFFKQWWVIPATLVSGFLGGLTASLINLDEAAKLSGGSLKFTTLLVGYAAPSILANFGGTVATLGSQPTPAGPPAPATLAHFLKS
ncbi:MAG: hypothetical protein QOH76_1305 [Thermoleophilaceae bacterium]|jgi:hypothetical protein|nr:hypothetical protein [Thermoleophilaceae bacterium]